MHPTKIDLGYKKEKEIIACFFYSMGSYKNDMEAFIGIGEQFGVRWKYIQMVIDGLLPPQNWQAEFRKRYAHLKKNYKDLYSYKIKRRKVSNTVKL